MGESQSEQFDPETGEMYGSKSTGFLKLFVEELHLLGDIGGAYKPMRLFLYFLRNMNDNNVMNRTQGQIAYELEMNRSYVSRILSSFERKKICVNGRGSYMMNPDFVWFGRDDRREKQVNVFRKRRLIKGLINE